MMAKRAKITAKSDDTVDAAAMLDRLRGWMRGRGWEPFAFQEEAWAAQLAGRRGLIHVPTGAGKTYASYLGALASVMAEGAAGGLSGLRVVYVTPLRAVSRDIEKALRLPVDELGLTDELGIKVEARTGDTSSSVRARQKRSMPSVLITTPESLSLLMSYANARELLGGVSHVIADEWHELLASKRGTQTELALARLRAWNPELRTWALSATLANLDEAARAAAGVGVEPVLVGGELRRDVVMRTVIPEEVEKMPWAGHLGIRMVEQVAEDLDVERSTLVFVNTRSQAERWFHALEHARPEWRDRMGLHHGSIDRATRETLEAGLKDGSVRLVVATSSLDLGVDFAPVERVYQVGSPKGIARVMQRAGRASHRPGEACEITCVPTYALELVEIAAVRRAMAEGTIEPRRPEAKPFDVLAQHMVTVGLGGGFEEDALYEEVRTSAAYADLTQEEFDWTLSLVAEGGGTLSAYPEYRKIERGEDGVWRVPGKRIAQLHRLNVGTISGDATMDIRFGSGKRLGSIEENFVSKLRQGEKFVFAGRTLEFQRVREMTCIVKPATGRSNHTPIWSGTRLPITESMGEAVRAVLSEAGDGEAWCDELAAVAPIVATQASASAIPRGGQLLVEQCSTREGEHLFVYPFEGRLVHGGLAAVLALRLSRLESATFTISQNDYGFELLTAKGYPFAERFDAGLLSPERIVEDTLEAVNLGELSKRQFREVARVAGLVMQVYPGQHKSARQVHATSGLIYDVLRDFDPGNLLLKQAEREVMERQFERSRLSRSMERLMGSEVVYASVHRPTPLGLPLVIERVGGQISSATLEERVERIRGQWQKDRKPSASVRVIPAPAHETRGAATSGSR